MKGFTLLEVMIVVTLIGILSSMAFLAMGSGDQGRLQKQEAERLLALFKLTSQEAVVSSSPIGLEFFKDGYRFLQLHEQFWQPEERDLLLRARALPANLHFVLLFNHKPLVLSTLASPSLRPKPQVIFTPDGDLSLFELDIVQDGRADSFRVVNSLADGLQVIAPPLLKAP